MPMLPLHCAALLAPWSLPVLLRVAPWQVRDAWRLGLALVGATGWALLVMGHAHLSPAPWWDLTQPRVHLLALLGPVLAGLLAWAWTLRRVPLDAPAWTAWARTGLTVLLVWSGLTAWLELRAQASGPLVPDAAFYLDLARHWSLTAPYATGPREPAWIWLIAAWTAVAGDSPVALRTLTVLCWLGVLLATAWCITGLTRRPVVGLGVAWWLATTPSLAQASLWGLREPAYTLALLGFLAGLGFPPERLEARRRLGLLAATAALLALLRITSAVFLVPLLAWWAWRTRQPWPRPVGILAVTALLLVPHVVHNARTFGDPLYSLNVHATFARNQEFVVQHPAPCPDCPPAEALTANAYAGAPVSTSAYLFGRHALGDLAGGLVAGYADVYGRLTARFTELTGITEPAVYGLYLLGWGLLLASPLRWLGVALLATANLQPFLIEEAGFMVRIVAHTAPLAALPPVLALVWLLTEAPGRTRRAVAWAGTLIERLIAAVPRGHDAGRPGRGFEREAPHVHDRGARIPPAAGEF